MLCCPGRMPTRQDSCARCCQAWLQRPGITQMIRLIHRRFLYVVNTFADVYATEHPLLNSWEEDKLIALDAASLAKCRAVRKGSSKAVNKAPAMRRDDKLFLSDILARSFEILKFGANGASATAAVTQRTVELDETLLFVAASLRKRQCSRIERAVSFQNLEIPCGAALASHVGEDAPIVASPLR